MEPKEPKESTESTVEHWQLLLGAEFLFAQFQQGGGIGYIGEAVVLDRQALELCPLGHPERWAPLTQLGYHLFHRYSQLGTMSDLEESIALHQEALDLCPRGHPDRSQSLDNLAVGLGTRYEQLGAMVDLNEAIVLVREALDLFPRGHPDRSATLNNLAISLCGRYQQLGELTDLNEAIVLGREALDLCPRGHPLRSSCLNDIANRLSTRYEQLGVITDINEAIALSREALDLRPRGHPGRSKSLSCLAIHLLTRYKQLRAMTDLNEAIVLNREALDLCPRGHPDRPLSLSNLAVDLSTRYKQLGAMADLDEAIVLDREALDLRPQGHPHRSLSLNNLAVCFSTRYDQLGAMTDLDDAIVLTRDVLQLRPPGHPYRSRALENLACYLRTRFTQSGQSKDKEDLFNIYAELTHVPQMVSSIDLSAAKAWVSAAEDFHHPTTVLAYETSLRLLIQHLATLPSLPQHLPILKKLTSSLAADAFSACLRNHDPVKAVELLEQGRGVFWNQITRLRSPLDDVVASGPAGKTLADEFTRLTSDIHSMINSPGADQHDRLCGLNLDLQGVVTNIRELPSLAHFLLPSLFSDLQHAASDGPIIIVNASKYTCDALIVFIDQDPVHIPLQITKDRVRDLSLDLQSLTLDAKRQDVTRDLGRILRQLWDEVVSPIVDLLQVTVPAQSRIWWCPTAEFSSLPLHAAGPYRRGQQNLSELYISSYTPTLTALIRARRHPSLGSVTEGKRFVAIGQREATGESELVSVGRELAIVGQRMEGLATFTCIEGSESCISRVSEELNKNEWVHLACHGLPNRQEPFQSAFALSDGHFTIEHIMRCELENAQFAYLSACHTTVGDEESLDEVIHLASAMHFVGFRSVIGTMWGVDDGQTNKITSMFYTHMTDESGCLDYRRAAFALNETMKRVDVPFDQRILYIHIGA